MGYAKNQAELINDYFTRQVSSYCKIGLWPSEQQLVDRYFIPGSRLLDIGCGAGRTTIALSRKGYRVTAFDIVPTMIDAAVSQTTFEQQPINYLLMDASRLAFKDNTFDGVLFSFNGYENIYNKESRKRLLSEVFRVLKPDNHFILTSRSGVAFGKRWLAWLYMFIRELVTKPLGFSNPHLELGNMLRDGNVISYVSPFSVRRLMRIAGFTIVEFNSDANLRAGNNPNFFTNFSNDICLFFVGRKT